MQRSSRFTIGEKIDALLLGTIEELFTATYKPANQKLSHLQQAASRLDLAKFFLQLAWEIKILETKRYTIISEQLDEISRMLGGWMRKIIAGGHPAEQF